MKRPDDEKDPNAKGTPTGTPTPPKRDPKTIVLNENTPKYFRYDGFACMRQLAPFLM